ncbi:hypothetical protein [Empedobacter brevis]
MEIFILPLIDIILLLILKIYYQINPWEIGKMIKLWNKRFGGM